MVETYFEKRLLGYARVSTYGQTLDSQLEQLRKGLAPDALLTTGAQRSARNCGRSFPMSDDTARPVLVWSVKFFRDLRSLTPTRLAYISRSSEEEVTQRALECMADEGVSR